MKFCPNERCEGACVYEGVSSVNGKLVEFYRCLRCFTLHKVEAESAAPLTGDEDTQELPRVAVIVETGAQS